VPQRGASRGDGLAARVLRSGRLCGEVTKPFSSGSPGLGGKEWRRPSRAHPDQITYALAVGDKARFWIPGNLAYGDKPARSGTPTGPLVFDIELLSIK
jgi:hypothetical protein